MSDAGRAAEAELVARCRSGELDAFEDVYRQYSTRLYNLAFRMVGNAADADDLLQEIIPTAIYYREKLEGQSLARVYYRSLRPDLVRLREILEGEFEAPTEPFNLAKAIPLGREADLDASAADAVAAAAGAARGPSAGRAQRVPKREALGVGPQRIDGRARRALFNDSGCPPAVRWTGRP